jgi:hypothetical protein
MKKVKISFEVNIDDYPVLNNFKDIARQNIIEEIFKTGYNIHFPSLEKIEQNHQYNELLCQINNSEISDKLTHLESSLSKLIGISSNSSKKGEMAEILLENIIHDRYGDLKFESKAQTPHSGDAWLYLPDNKIIMLESKNYTSTVNKDEVIKLQSDMITHHIKWGILVSFNSMIQGMKELDFHTFLHNNETYSIIMVSNLSMDYHKLDLGLQIIRKLILKFDNLGNFPWIINDITQNLNELNQIVKKNYCLRDAYYTMEKDIQKILSNYHVCLRDYQYDLELKINEIISKIQATTDKSIDIKTSESYEQILSKYEKKKILPLIVRIVDLCQQQSWKLENESDDNLIIKNHEVIGYVKVQIKKILININDISLIFNIGNDKEIKQNFEIIKSILL